MLSDAAPPQAAASTLSRSNDGLAIANPQRVSECAPRTAASSATQPATGSRARLDDDLQSISTDEELDGIALHKAIEDPELQAAIAMSLEDSHRSASPSGRKVTFTRSLDEAGIPATPGSARGHRKKRSGK